MLFVYLFCSRSFKIGVIVQSFIDGGRTIFTEGGRMHPDFRSRGMFIGIINFSYKVCYK